VNQGTTVLCTFPVDGPRSQSRGQAAVHESRKIA